MVRKEGNNWRVQIQRGGVLHSTTRPTRKEAQAFESSIIEDWKLRRTGGSKRYTVSEGLERWAREELPRQKAKLITARHAKQLIPYQSNKFLDEISEVWSEYKRDHGHLKAATINRKGAILRRIANLAFKEWQWLKAPIFITLLKENNKRKVYVTKAELDVIIEACTCVETKALLQILYYTGMRVGELLKAVPVGEVLVVSDTKNGQPAYIPMHKEIVPLLSVFPFRYKYHYYFDRFDEARKKVGMEYLHIHDIRHSTASALISLGATMIEVRDTLRHSAIATTNRYLHLNLEGVKRTIDRL